MTIFEIGVMQHVLYLMVNFSIYVSYFFLEVLVIVFWIAIFAMKLLLFYLTLLLNKDGKCNLFMF
jgi:hypothetical protein